MSSSRLVGKGWTQSGDSSSWQTWQFLLFYSRTYLRVARTLFYHNLCWKITQSILSRLRRIQDNHILTTCAFFVLLLFIRTEIRNWKKKHQKFSVFSSTEWMDSALLSSEESIWTIFPLLRNCAAELFLDEIILVVGTYIGELARRSVQKVESTVRLLKHKNHICYVSNIKAVFQSFRCTVCDTFLNRTSNWKQELTSCIERVKHVYPKNVYQILETFLDKLNSFGSQYTKEQAFFTKFAVFYCESVCVQEKNFKDTDTAKGIGKHIPISISISSNLVQPSIFVCNPVPQNLVASFAPYLENLVFHSKIQMKTLFLDIVTAIKSRLQRFLQILSQRHNRRGQFTEAEGVCFQKDSDDNCASSQFFQMKKISWLICKNNGNVNVTCCLSLVLTVPNLTLIWSNPF